MTKRIIQLITSTLLMSGFVLMACSNKANDSKIESARNTVDLNWKLPDTDSLKYQTVMTPIGESSFKMNFGELFDKITDKENTEMENFGKTFFKKLKDFNNNTNLITILTKSENFDDVINIEMIAEEKEKSNDDDKDSMSQMMHSILKGTMLRGSVYSNGSLHSFWMKSRQKNLLSLFFELPNKSIKKGDSWTLHNVNFIGNDQNFICKECEKKNTITLIDIKHIDAETIAVIDYDIVEYVSGDFNMPAFMGNKASKKKTTMKFIYKARAEFSIDKGKWISYNGIMALNASGALNSVQKQKFALIER